MATDYKAIPARYVTWDNHTMRNFSKNGTTSIQFGARNGNPNFNYWYGSGNKNKVYCPFSYTSFLSILTIIEKTLITDKEPELAFESYKPGERSDGGKDYDNKAIQGTLFFGRDERGYYMGVKGPDSPPQLEKFYFGYDKYLRAKNSKSEAFDQISLSRSALAQCLTSWRFLLSVEVAAIGKIFNSDGAQKQTTSTSTYKQQKPAQHDTTNTDLDDIAF